MKINAIIATAASFALLTPAFLAATDSTEYMDGPIPQNPTPAASPAGTSTNESANTAIDRVQELNSRYQVAKSGLSALFNRLHEEPELLGTRELFSQLDATVREMKNIRSRNTSQINTIRREIRTITTGTTFSKQQQEELSTAGEALIAQCEELATSLSLAIERLAAAYTILPKWNRQFKAYQNLQGETAARSQIRSLVEEFLSSFVPAQAQTGEAESANGLDTLDS